MNSKLILDTNNIRAVNSINMVNRDYVLSSITDEVAEEDKRIEQFGRISEMRFETANMMLKSTNNNDEQELGILRLETSSAEDHQLSMRNVKSDGSGSGVVRK